MALNRPRLAAALCAALIALAIPAAPAVAAVDTRVEGPTANLFQGMVAPAAGTLTDQDGMAHSTAAATALGALVAASRSKPFPLELAWSDAFGGGWAGFYVTAIDGVAPPPTAFWAFKLNQKLAPLGLGSTPVTARSRVLVYYTTFDPVTFATEPTLGISAPATAAPGSDVTVTVNQFDDAGHPSPAAGARLVVDGRPSVRVDATGHAVLHLGHDGTVRIRAKKTGTIRSKTLWVRVASSS